jgi:hypothetical protein
MNNLLRMILVCALLAFAVFIIAFGVARNTSDLLAPVHLLLFLCALAVYLLPAGLAFYRDSESVLWITAANVLLGWTVIGWFVTIGWAAGGKVRTVPPAIALPPARPIPGH